MIGLVLVALFLSGSVPAGIKAQTLFKYYFPINFKAEPTRFDDFADADPAWHVTYLMSIPSNPDLLSDCRPERSLYFCEIKDNADRVVSSPGWRPLGDFALEVDARFDAPQTFPPDLPVFQTRNGLGMVFSGSDNWYQYYAYMLGFWGSQPAWSVQRFDGINKGENVSLSAYGGAPPYVKGFDGWNHLTVVRVKDLIYVYANGYQMPMPAPYYDYIRDGTYGTNRLVGLTVTSWEVNFGKMEFDNFRLTPLSMPY